MKNVLKSILITSILTLAFNLSFSQSNHKTINLFLIPNTDQLIIPDILYVDPGDSLSWVIYPGENIDMFRIKGPGSHPFKSFPNGNYRSIDVAVRPNATRGSKWKYKISYKIKSSGKWIDIDPKIAVLPTTANYLILSLILLSTLIIMSFTTLHYRSKWLKVLRDNKNLPSNT